VRAISLSALIENIIAEDTRRYIGNVKDLAELYDETSLRVFEEHQGGAFAFLAFHPTGDASVAKYLKEGTLASDSGRSLLVLFTSFADVDMPQEVTSYTLGSGLVIEAEELPAQQMTNALFGDKGAPPLPGLLVFKSLVEQQEALYFGLDGFATATELRSRLRMIFSLVDHVVKQRNNKSSFAEQLAVLAQRRQLAFVRSGQVSMRQRIVQAYQFLGRHGAELAAALGIGKA
jgi:hypothetical protein